MPNYSDIGLNDQLQRFESLAAKKGSSVTSYDFGSLYQVPANSLDYSKFRVSARPFAAVVSLSKERGTFNDIQEALTYVNNQGGGKILILSGTYTINKELTIYSDTTLEGLVTGDCILDFNNTTNNITATQANDLLIKNLTFTNCRDTTNGTFYLDRCTRVKFNNCIFDDNRDGSNNGYDIYSHTTTDLSIELCKATDSATFLYLDSGSFRSKVSNSNIKCKNKAIWGAVSLSPVSNVYVSNCYIESSQGAIYGSFQTSTFIGNDLTTETAEAATEPVIYIFATSRRVSFIGNTIIPGDSDEQGVLIDGTSGGGGFVNHISFTTNNITAGENDDGVKLIAADDCRFVSNNISSQSGTSYAINISTATCDRTIVVANSLSGNTGDVNDAGTASVIANNS